MADLYLFPHKYVNHHTSCVQLQGKRAKQEKFVMMQDNMKVLLVARCHSCASICSLRPRTEMSHKRNIRLRITKTRNYMYLAIIFFTSEELCIIFEAQWV